MLKNIAGFVADLAAPVSLTMQVIGPAGRPFGAGERLNGSLFIVTTRPLEIHDLDVEVEGTEATRWVEHKTRTYTDSNGQTQTEHYDELREEHHHFLKDKFCIPLCPPGSAALVPPGNHQFPFSYPLPPGIPSSFSHAHGSIRYTLKSILEKPGMDVKSEKLEVPVHGHTSLPLLMQAHTPASLFKEKTFNKCFLLCCVQTPPLRLNVDLPQTHYVPGEVIPLNLRLENHSGKAINALKATLVKHMLFRAGHHTKNESVTVLNVQLHNHVHDVAVNLSDRQLPVPSDLIDLTQKCRLIEVTYVLRVEVVMDETFALNPVLEAPIVITWACCRAPLPPLPEKRATYYQ